MNPQRPAPTEFVQQPAEALLPGVSACMIVRDEEQCLARCLSSLAPFVDELCVVDTGSEDRTVEIAKQFGARVRHLTWQDDWSLARNASLQMATRRWILVVDADEELTGAGGAALRRAIRSTRRQAFLVRQHNLVGDQQAQQLVLPRLFRNRPEIRFTRRIHESVMNSLIALGAGELTESNVHLVHHGYLESYSRSRDKHRRNLSIMRKCQQEDPADLYLLHKLSNGLRGKEDRDERIAVLEEAIGLSRRLSLAERRSYPFLPMVFEALSSERLKDGKLGEAIEICEEGLATFKEATDLMFLRGDLARRVGAEGQARKFLGACVGRGAQSPLYLSNPDTRGLLPMKGLIRPAVEADRIEEARLLLGHTLSMRPDDVSLRRLEVEVKLARPDTCPDGIDRLDRLIEEFPEDPDVLLITGQFAWSTGEAETALSLWRRAAAHDADSDIGLEARCLLGLGLLSTGDLEAAFRLQPDIVARDLPAAACKLVLSVIEAGPVELDPAFDRDRLTAHVLGILKELLAAPGQRAATRFAQNAARYEQVLPGIAALLLEE